jgi:hypothetical protein
MIPSRQLKAFVEHSRKRTAIRNQIEAAKASGDVDSEWQGRQQMQDYWSKVPTLRTEAVAAYNGDEGKMLQDAKAYHLLTYGESIR